MPPTLLLPRPARRARRPLRARPGDQDGGFALLSVIAGMSALLVIVTVVLSFSTKSLNDVRHTEKWNQAFVAAEAGVNDYLARLNQDDGYWTKYDCTNLALKGPRSDNACGYKPNTAPGWLGVPGSERGEFHYEVNTAATYTTGTVLLTSTGRVSDVTRTVQVRLRRSGFGEFLYYTVYETLDPANEAYYGFNNTTAADKCSHYFWEPNLPPTSKPRDTSYCSNINFITGDVIDGPLHTNDAMLVQGRPTFNGTTTTSWPQCKPVNGVKPPASSCYRASGSGVAPTFSKGIAYRAEVQLPESASDLRKYVDRTQTTNPGCLYTGPTRIKINENAAGAASTMTVWSKFSKGTLNPNCGNTSASWPQTVPIPQNNIIIIQDVPATQSTPSSGACAAGAVGDNFPQSGDFAQTLRESDCRYGTLYLEGKLKGRLTIAADNNILITGPITYAGGTQGTDALGLIATNSVKIYHPTSCTQTSGGKCTSGTNMKLPNNAYNSNVSVYAAILTLQHSFTVQQYQLGAPLGKINLYGTIAQKFRGPVGTSSNGVVQTGYLKGYVYDTRLRFAPPPFFLDPVRASWDVKTFGELAAKYR